MEDPVVIEIPVSELWFRVGNESGSGAESVGGGGDGGGGGKALERACLRNMFVSSDARFLLSEGVLKMNVQEDWLDQFRDAESRFEEASELINRGKPDEALPMLRRLLEFNPYHSRTRLALAETLGDLDRAADALDELIDGLRIDPENGDFYCYALRYFPDSDQMAAAEERYARMAVELGTCNPMARMLLGQIAFGKNCYSEAMEHFESIPDNPENGIGRAFSCYGKSNIHYARNKFVEAAKELEAAFSALVRDHGNQFLAEARQDYLSCCAQIDRRTRTKHLKLAIRELTAIEAELGWSIERREIELDEEKNWEPILWQSLDRPGSVVIQGPATFFEDAECLMAHAEEIRIESVNPRKQGIQHLRRTARQLAATACKEIQFNSDEPIDDDSKEQLLRSLLEISTEQIHFPLYWLCLRRVIAKFPQMKWACILSLQIEAESELEILAMLAEGEETLAPPISTGYTAMLGAKALFLERLSQGVLKAPAIHRQQPTWPRSLAIHDHWQTRVDAGLKPGSEAALLTEIATLAGFISDPAPRVQGRLF